MKPAPFDYVRPTSLDEAAALKAEAGEDARILAGGQSLIAMLNMRLATPRQLIDVSQLRDEVRVELRVDHLAIGCAATQAALMARDDLGPTGALLAAAMPHVGHLQTRSKGTVCGSVAHADPSSEIPLCLAMHEGEVVLRRGAEARVVAARNFFLGPLQTACGPDEMIAEVRFKKSRARIGFREMALRHGDFAIIAVAVMAWPEGVRVGIAGTAGPPAIADWDDLNGSALDDALNELAWSLDCQGDVHASAKYRRHLIRTLGRAAIEDAWREAP